MDIQNNPTPEEVWRAFQLIGFIATGRMLVAQPIGTTATEVKHYLGRTPIGWIQVAPRAGATVVTQSTTIPTSTSLYLQTATANSVDLWVW